MVTFSVTLNSYLVGLVDTQYIYVCRSIDKSIGESIGNIF